MSSYISWCDTEQGWSLFYILDLPIDEGSCQIALRLFSRLCIFTAFNHSSHTIISRPSWFPDPFQSWLPPFPHILHLGGVSVRVLQRSKTNRLWLFYFKELAHAVAKTGKSEICRAAWNSGRSWCYSLEAEFLLPGKPQFLLLRPSLD